ncbi:hypothetical protein OUZ56_032941 [Daphnia magna]|uniref:Uncharacterized protein n=1 Tax=Daphnia magna TaxID=35525 RepID=A0ABQ9ZY79_9CRUS|nr:hypothetical protein OUZ56_032941 [Daphnia magna]
MQKKSNPRLPSCPRDRSRRLHPEQSPELSGGESATTGPTQDPEFSTSIENIVTSETLKISQIQDLTPKQIYNLTPKQIKDPTPK